METSKIVNDKSIIDTLVSMWNAYGGEVKEINFIGVRNMNDIRKGLWNDTIILFTEDQISCVKGTCDPSPYYQEHPMNPEGLGQLCHGMQKDIWVDGLHGKSQYRTLVNTSTNPKCKPQKLWRMDKGFNYILNPDGSRKVWEGYYGANYHHENAQYDEPTIGIWSAACCVPMHYGDWQYQINLFWNSGMVKDAVSLLMLDDSEMIKELIIP